MQVKEIPDELLDDIQSKKNYKQRYYLAKVTHWNRDSIRPHCQVIKSIGEAGNLEAESIRILKTYDVHSDEYGTQEE